MSSVVLNTDGTARINNKKAKDYRKKLVLIEKLEFTGGKKRKITYTLYLFF